MKRQRNLTAAVLQCHDCFMCRVYCLIAAVRGRTKLVARPTFRKFTPTWDCATLSTGIRLIHCMPKLEVKQAMSTVTLRVAA